MPSGTLLDGALEHHGEELLAHEARLRLALDLVAVDRALTPRVRAQRVAALHRARAVVLDRADDLERAALRRRVGHDAHAGSVWRKPPVRRQRHEALAVRAADRPRPQVSVDAVSFRLGGKDSGVLRQRHLDKPCGKPIERIADLQSEAHRCVDGLAQQQRRDGVQVVRQRVDTETHCLERDAATAGGRVENDRRCDTATASFRAEPIALSLGRRVRERPRIAVDVRTEVLTRALGRVDPKACLDGIPVDPEHAHELLAVRVGREQRREHRGA
jgi:hypothetical protein